ncbi:sensor histidine kinase [Clostridium thermarum]|uniref:sensor histidine kinase n=1 Tax=Clostridium thermarum TaxID=1716543 RepID=UPI0011244B4A|nr:HAMP domain-containing sensor histidine kinase [Clostridium thermarum]
MFKELKKKFLMLNLVIISVTMLAAFLTIYLITYNNTRREIDMELRKLSEFNRKPTDGFMDRPGMNLSDFDQTPPKRSVSFVVYTDSKGNKLATSSIFELEDIFYETAKNIALSKNTEKGRLKLDGTHWAYMKTTYFDGYKITFLDISDSQGILTRLIYTFAAVAAVMLIVIYFISRFFANRSIEPIKEAFDKQKQFIGDASHELKTPLSVINTNVDVLLANSDDTISDQSRWLYYIKSEVERMARLTNDLLYLTQVDYSETKMIFSEFNLSEAVESVLLTMEAMIFENNIYLDYDIEPNITIKGNSEQFKQVVMILLDNALKYTNPKGKVTMVLKKNHNNVILTVSNTGKGIPEEHLPKIFDRFYRIDKSRARNSGGYGLGLAIAKTIVQQHGGKISVKSIENELTTFTIEL